MNSIAELVMLLLSERSMNNEYEYHVYLWLLSKGFIINIFMNKEFPCSMKIC